LGEEIDMIPQSDGTFQDMDGGRYRYVTTDSGEVAFSFCLFGMEYYLCDVLGELSVENFDAFIGDWAYVPSVDDTYMNGLYAEDALLTISTGNGYPAVVDSESGLSIPLVAVDETTCYQPGYGRDEGYVIDLVDIDGVSCLRYMGMLFAKQ